MNQLQPILLVAQRSTYKTLKVRLRLFFEDLIGCSVITKNGYYGNLDSFDIRGDVVCNPLSFLLILLEGIETFATFATTYA